MGEPPAPLGVTFKIKLKSPQTIQTQLSVSIDEVSEGCPPFFLLARFMFGLQ